MASDIVGHRLYDNQIDYDYIPQDVFLEENAYGMKYPRGVPGEHAGVSSTDRSEAAVCDAAYESGGKNCRSPRYILLTDCRTA